MTQPKDQRIPIMMTISEVQAIDRWRSRLPDLPPRAEAIRRLVAQSLGSPAGEIVDDETVKIAVAQRFQRLPGRPRKPSGTNDSWDQSELNRVLADRESVTIAELCVALIGHDLATVKAGHPGMEVETQDAFDGRLRRHNPTFLPANPHIESALKIKLARHGWIEVRDTATRANAWVPEGSI